MVKDRSSPTAGYADAAVIGTVRPARPHEAPRLSHLAMASKAHWGYDRAFMEACRAELTVDEDAMAGHAVGVCEDETGLAGFYGLAAEGTNGEVTHLFVAPDRMGRGVGRALWRDLVRVARARGLSRIMIDSDPNAEGFYRAQGCRPAGWAQSGSLPGRRLPRFEYDVGAGGRDEGD
jgi:GNAT superfamily N-acetyltransferase